MILIWRALLIQVLMAYSFMVWSCDIITPLPRKIGLSLMLHQENIYHFKISLLVLLKKEIITKECSNNSRMWLERCLQKILVILRIKDWKWKCAFKGLRWWGLIPQFFLITQYCGCAQIWYMLLILQNISALLVLCSCFARWYFLITEFSSSIA